MATVPYNPVPNINPTISGERVSISATDEAFGGPIARGMEHLGTTGEQIGTELYQRATALQDLQNETMAREQAVKTTQQMAMRYEKFKELGEGMSAPGQLEAFQNDIEKLRQDGRNTLPNAHAQRFFDAEAASLQNRVTMASAASAGDANKAHTIGVAEAKMDLDTRAWTNPKDPKERQQKMDSMRQGVDTIGGVRGWDPVQTEDFKFKKGSKLIEGQIYAVGRLDSEGGFSMLDDAIRNKQITQEDADSAKAFLIQQNRIVGAEVLAKKVFDYSKTLDDMVDEVHQLAPKYAHGDELFDKHAVNAIQNMDLIRRKGQQDGWNRAKQTVDEAIGTGKYHSVQEMAASDPMLAVAINSQKPEDVNSTPKRLFQHFKDEDYELGKPNFDMLKGKALENPQGFLAEDLYAYRLNGDQRNALLLLRKQLLHGSPVGDPQVQKAAAWIGRQYPKTIPRDHTSTQYLSFLGSLQNLMEDFQAEKRAKLTPDDYDRMGKVLVQEVANSGMFPWSSNYHVFDEPVPGSVMEHYKNLGLTNEDEITNIYRRGRSMDEYQRLFGGSAKPKPTKQSTTP